MASTGSKKKTPTVTVRMEVTDINEHSNTIFMEGDAGDFKYILMIDADLNDEMVAEAVVGDKYDVTLREFVKMKKKVTASGKVVTGQMKGNTCTGSGKTILKKDVSARRATSYYSTMRTTCPDCGKDIAVNGGYGNKPYTVRKHNV